MTQGTPASSQIIWLEGRVQELESKVAVLIAQTAHLEGVLEAEKLVRKAANTVIGEQMDGLIAAIANCRDVFPAPVPGSELDGYYVGAIADPLAVPDYVKAVVAALTLDAGRYRWLRDQDDRSDAFCMYGSNNKFGECGHHEIGSELLDEVIDAAMAQKGTV